MTKTTYYLDSCIWINLFKKEGDATKGTPYWKIAKDFVERANKIIVSTIVIKEISFKVEDKYSLVMKFFKESKNIKMIKTEPCDYDLARKYEWSDKFRLGFYDYLHVAIAKRLNLTLITRDKELIEFAKNYILVFKPEELIT